MFCDIETWHGDLFIRYEKRVLLSRTLVFFVVSISLFAALPLSSERNHFCPGLINYKFYDCSLQLQILRVRLQPDLLTLRFLTTVFFTNRRLYLSLRPFSVGFQKYFFFVAVRIFTVFVILGDFRNICSSYWAILRSHKGFSKVIFAIFCNFPNCVRSSSLDPGNSLLSCPLS